MPRDPRFYITVHDGMPNHPKVEPLSDAAFRLIVESWCYSHQFDLDGRIKAALWQKRGKPKVRAELVAAGLVEMDGQDAILHDYLEHQQSADEIKSLRAKRADAGRKGGLAKAAAQQEASNGLATATAPAKQTPSKSVADRDIDRNKNLLPDADAPGGEPRPDLERLCLMLADRIESNGSKRPSITKAWLTACRLMLDKDGRTVGQVERMIDWCQRDSFWRSNILSMPTLREKYDQMRLKAMAEPAAPAKEWHER